MSGARRGRKPRYPRGAEIPTSPPAAEDPVAPGDAQDGVALLTPHEVADLFHVKLRTVQAWGKAGRFGAVRIGGPTRFRLRFRASDVRAVVEGRGKATP